MFSSLRQGATLYILEKSDPLTLKTGQVTFVGAQTPKYTTATPGVGIGMNTEMVVDVKAKAGEQDYDFKQLPVSSGVMDYGNAFVADSREAMLSEVDRIKAENQQELERVESRKKIVASCDDILKVLNPSFAKEQERDAAIRNLDERFSKMENAVAGIYSMIEKSLTAKGEKTK